MDLENGAPYQFTGLNVVMNEAYKKRVVQNALTARSHISPECRARLNAAIDRRIALTDLLPGEDHTTKLNRLRPALVEHLFDTNDLASSILESWAEGMTALRKAVRAYIEKHPELGTGKIDWKVGFAEIWPHETMLETAADLHTTAGVFDLEDVRLMLCLELDRLPIPQEEISEYARSTRKVITEPKTTTSQPPAEPVSRPIPHWQSWLDELKVLPAEAPEWDCIDDLLVELKSIAVAKLEARGLQSRKASQLLENIKTESDVALEYFGFQDFASWDAGALTEKEAQVAGDVLGAFRERLTSYPSLSAEKSTTLAESREKRSRLERMETELNDSYAKLQAIFRGHSSWQFTAPGSQKPEQVPTGEVTANASQTSTHLEDEPVVVTSPKNTISTPAPEVIKQLKPEIASLDSAGGSRESEQGLVSSQTIVLGKLDAETPKVDQPDIPLKLPLPMSKSLVEKPGQTISACAANALIAHKTGLARADFISALLIDDRIGTAYWLAKAAEMQGDIEMPSWLLAAIHGARWITAEDDSLVTDLLEISKNHSPDRSSETICILALSAALKPALIAPYSGLSAWLYKTHVEPIDRIKDAVVHFAETGMALHTEDISGIAGADRRDTALNLAINDAKQWLIQAPQRRVKSRASGAWHRLAGPKGALSELVKLTADNRKSDLADVRQQLERWRDHESILEIINRTDSETHKLKEAPITGSARDQLEGHISDAISIVSRWYSLATHEAEIEAHGNWIFSQAERLRSEVSDNLDAGVAALDEIAGGTSLNRRAAALCLKRAVLQVAELLQVKTPMHVPATAASETSIIKPAPSLSASLSHELLFFPELTLLDNTQPSEADLVQIVEITARAISGERTLEDAFAGWIKKQDYRFAEFFDGRLKIDVSALLQQAKNSSRSALLDLQENVQNEIEQSIVDGIITDEDRSRFGDQIEQIDPTEVLNFSYQLDVLNSVRATLQTYRQQRLDQLAILWKNIAMELAASRHIPAEQQTKIAAAVETSLARSDTRVVEEYLSRIRPILDARLDWDETWDPASSNQDRDVVDEFLDASPDLDAWISSSRLEAVATQIKTRGIHGDINYGNVPTPRLDEANLALTAWRQLKHLRLHNDPAARGYLKQVLTYLGFTFNAGTSQPVSLAEHGDDWLYARVSMSDFSLAKPIYQFGSQAQGKYHVVCLWERPAADTIASRLRQLRLKQENVLLFYLGRLGIKQRTSLIRLCYEDKFNLAVLDEVLMVFLARERDARLPAFLSCALPFATVNPYTPFKAGDVPPEMFYGREEMVRELEDPKGTCLVYGGRQLGKSALLKHVERDFHNPDRGQFAAVIDIKLIGSTDAQLPTDGIWKKLRDRFKEFGILGNDIKTGKAEEIERLIHNAVLENTERRFLLLFDEADNFLDADARGSFRITERFRTLMLETNRRFKVVFAGLHNVQRFQSLPNQPFAHFGTPLLVGPLDPKAAVSLIHEPMQMLGYHFRDPSGPLRILSFTNYHPGLIQLFCQDLLSRLNSSKANRMPPYEIAQEDIEAIYRQVRERIKERFDWTLALDQAYQAIAWTMILDQIQVRDSYSHAYRTSEILSRLKNNLRARFGHTSHEELAGLLEEMQGLGVLVRDPEGSYRLRSPNMVRLIGSETEIETKLIELMEKPVGPKSVSNSYHAVWGRNLASPLTFEQERSLGSNKTGTCLVFASEALGWQTLPEVLKRAASPEEEDGVADVVAIPLWVSTAIGIKEWLEKRQHQSRDKQRLYAYYPLDSSSQEEMKNLVQGASEYCSSRRASQILRVVFIYGATATKKWLQLPAPTRQRLEDGVIAAISAHVWNIDGIAHRLRLSDMLANSKVCEAVHESTGGWPILLDELLERVGSHDDPRNEADRLSKELDDRNSDIFKRFRHSLGLEQDPADLQLLKYLVGFNGQSVPIEYVMADTYLKDTGISELKALSSIEYLARMSCIVVDPEKSIIVDKFVLKATD